MEAVVIPTFVGLSVTAYLVKKFGSRNEESKDQPVIQDDPDSIDFGKIPYNVELL